MSLGMAVYTVAVVVGIAGWAWAGSVKRAAPVVLLFLATLLGFILAALNAVPNPGLAAFLVWMATLEALGPTSSMILQVIKSFMPSLEDKAAMAASFVGAVLLCILAKVAMPYATSVPPILDQTFALIVWAIQQIWYIYAPPGTVLTRS